MSAELDVFAPPLSSVCAGRHDKRVVLFIMHDAAYSTRIRKPKRRAATTSSRSRAATRGSRASTPPRAARVDPQPPPHAWVSADFDAIALELARHRNTELERFFGGSHPRLPPQLTRKTRGDVIALLRRLVNVGQVVPHLQLARCDFGMLLAVLAAERCFVSETQSKTDEAAAALERARSETVKVQRERVKLGAETRALSEQMREQRAETSRLCEEKAATDSSLGAMRAKYTQLRANYKTLRDTLCNAKLSELEMRRRLDRLQLKIGALLGDVIIPTLDTLSDSQPQWLADTHIPLLTQQTSSSAPASSPPNKKRADELRYDELLHESKEQQQMRLLTYRLAMCDMESDEWRHTLAHEQQRIALIARATRSLEEQVARQKQLNRDAQPAKGAALGTMGSGTRSGSKGGGGGGGMKTVAKIRAAVRATLPTVADIGSVSGRTIVKKKRKGRARKSLWRSDEDCWK